MTTLESVLKTTVQGLGYDFWGCQTVAQDRHTLLRLYIDHETGVSIEDCAKVSRQLTAVLNAEEIIQGSFSLEVSSPGLDRCLFTLDHFHQYIGEEVKVKLFAPLDGRGRFRGLLKAVDDASITVVDSGETYVIPFVSVRKANVIAKL